MFNKMNREKKIITTSFIGIGGNILLVALKATIGLLANSISIIMDAINNLSDALSSVITIIGTKLAGKKPDKKHPYGHGRVEYLTSLVIAVIILVAGIMAIYESIMALVNHETPTYNNISLIVISIGIVIKVILGLFFKKIGKETHSDALSGSGLDALFDALLSAGTLVGALVAMFANVYIEGYIGILIGLFIIKSGIGVLMESVSNIIGQRANSDISRKSSLNKNIQNRKGAISKIKFINLIFQKFFDNNDISMNNKFIEFNYLSSINQSDFGKVYYRTNYISKSNSKYIISNLKNKKSYLSMFVYIILYSIEEKKSFFKISNKLLIKNYLSILIKLYKQKIIDKNNLLIIIELISLLSIYERVDFTSTEFPKNKMIKNYKIFKYSIDIIKRIKEVKIAKEYLDFI